MDAAKDSSSHKPTGKIEDNNRRMRIASVEDIDKIWAIDSSATKKFGSIPALADLAAHEESPEKFQDWLKNGRVYLLEESDQVLGFTAVHIMDQVLYIDEIAAHEDHQGKGVGGSLLHAIFQRARERARENGNRTARVSLITYADVPWNGPWYKKHGFRETNAGSIGQWHVHKMTDDPEERDLVRPGYRRSCMIWEEQLS